MFPGLRFEYSLLRTHGENVLVFYEINVGFFGQASAELVVGFHR